MKSKEYAIDRIKENLSSMPDGEHKIACYILENQDKIIYMTIKQLAKATGVSEASIIKFSSKLGYTGFSELRINLAKQGQESNNYVYDTIEEQDSPKLVMRKMIDNAKAAMEATYEIISEDQMNKIASILQNAEKRIEVYGVGSSSMIAQDIFYRLMRMGLPAYAITDPHIAAVSASLMDSKCVAIGISHSGRSVEILESIKIAKEHGATTIGLTSFGKSPLTEVCDYNLIVTSRESQVNEEAVTARLAQLLVFDTICAYISCQMGEKSMEYMENVVKIIDSHRKK